MTEPDAASAEPGTAGASDENDAAASRVENLPRDVGWVLIYFGILGVIVPGIPGAPFLIAGAAVLTPGGPQWLARRVRRNPSRFVRGSVKQFGRFLDDMDSRYPAYSRTGRTDGRGDGRSR